ncbi:MAG: prolyl oligopeptidase family serine peptidase [Acidobacteriota bacterium]
MPIRVLLTTAALACVALAASAQPAPLTVERVASLPSLIGTAPASPVWSPDSRLLAFRWNDEGWPFRDIWIVGADGTGLRRLTDLERTHPPPPPPEGRSTEALAAQSAARARGGVSEIVWLPDSRGLLFVLRGRLYRVALDGTSPEPLPPADGVSDVSLAPDGARVAFLRAGDLWVWPIDGSTPPTRLTSIGAPGIAGVPLGTYNRADAEVGTGVWGASWTPYAWAPDGGAIVFHHVDRRHIRRVPFPSYLGPETVVSELRRGYPGDENERRSLSIVDVATRAVRPVALEAPGWRAISDFAWSRDGRLLVDQVSDTGTDRWIWIVDAGAVTPRLVWHDHRATRIYPAYVARWHPDGRRIVLVADISERDHLYALDTGAAAPTPAAITSGDWDVAGERGTASLHMLADGGVVFTGTLRSPYERHVYRQAAGGRPEAITSLPGVHVPFVSPDGRRLATLWSDDVTPPELLVSALAPGAAPVRVTTSPPPEFARHPWARARYATFTNAVDGFPVHARILEPTGLDRSRRHPVIFGPVYSNTVRNRWGGLSGTLQQYLVQRGFIVVQADVRGSVGYGRAFREAFLMDYGGKDLDDLQAVVDGLRALPYVDGRRIGVWGSSYGGLLTVYALLKRPGLFAAGVAGAPAVDPHAFGPDDVAITRSPETHPEAFVRGSALGLGDDLRDPLLIIHGLMDDVVPFRTTMALAERLMLLGKDFDLATAPGATHAWTAREHYAVFFYRKLVQFFERHLAARPAG